MKAQCKIEFFDKVAKVTRKPGEIFDLTAKRFNEITSKGRYIEAADDTGKSAEAAPKK